jgi:murein biosynthesis integral membrane protein MurJ
VRSLRKSTKLTGGKQLSLMMVITTISQMIAIYKSTIIAAHFGASTELDAYNFANNMATFILTIVASGITTVVIPSYIKKVNKDSIDTFISVIFTVVGAALVVLFAGRGILVDILTNRDSVFKATVCNLMLLTIFIQLLPALLGVTAAYYQVEDRYNTPKIIQLLSNIMVIGLLIGIKDFTIEIYLWILLSGAVIQFIVDLAIAIMYGFRFKLCFIIKDAEYKRLLNIFTPTIFSSGIYKVNTMIDMVISSNLATGQLTILSYANTMVGMVNNMFIGNLSTYSYTKIVKAIKEDAAEGQKALWRYSSFFHTAVCLIVVGFISVGREFIAILFEHGEFTSAASDRVYICMCIYILGQQNNIVRDLVYRYFYAQGDTKTTTKNSLTVSIINAITSIILARFIGLYGLVLGSVLSGSYSIVAIIWRMKKQYGFLVTIIPAFKEFAKNLLATFISIMIIIAFKQYFVIGNNILAFLVYGSGSVFVYAISLFVTRSQVFCKHNRL